MVWSDGAVFSSDSTLSGSVGGGRWELLSGFKSGMVERYVLKKGRRRVGALCRCSAQVVTVIGAVETSRVSRR